MIADPLRVRLLVQSTTVERDESGGRKDVVGLPRVSRAAAKPLGSNVAALIAEGAGTSSKRGGSKLGKEIAEVEEFESLPHWAMERRGPIVRLVA